MTQNTDNKKRTVALIAALLTAALALFICWAASDPSALEPVKTIVLNVEHSDGSVATVELKTTARTLTEAAEELTLLEISDVSFGRIVSAADGELPAEENSFWAFSFSGGDTYYFNVNDRPLQDGDVIEFFLVTY